MKSILQALIPAIALTAAAFAAGDANDADAPFGKRVITTEAIAASQAGSYDVYIDGPTGFAFVNTVNGWTFIRQIESSVMLASRDADEKL